MTQIKTKERDSWLAIYQITINHHASPVNNSQVNEYNPYFNLTYNRESPLLCLFIGPFT